MDFQISRLITDSFFSGIAEVKGLSQRTDCVGVFPTITLNKRFVSIWSQTPS